MDERLGVLLGSIPNPITGQRYILGLDGLSRSGKTTLTNKLKDALRRRNIEVLVFHLDDYIVERSKRYNTGHDEWFEYYFLQWDIESLRDNLFKKLRDNKTISLAVYDASSDQHVIQNVVIPDTCIIIVEGVFLQRKEWRNYLDFTLYLDCPRETRFSRESMNTQKEIDKFKKRYWKAEDFYLNTEKPKYTADCVIIG